MNVVALAGRRIDPDNAEVTRFPLDHVPTVRDAIRALFQETRTQALVCSAACGADLLALDIADELGLCVVVVLPFATERFRSTSVIDRPGDWGPIFDRLVSVAQQRGGFSVVDHEGTNHDAYLRVTETVLQKAIELSKESPASAVASEHGKVIAAVVWEGVPRGAGDHTAHFASMAHAQGIEVRTILTRSA